MTTFKIRSSVLKAKGEKFQTVFRDRADTKLAEVQQIDPSAKLLILPAAR